jgi:hypothetical protein
MTPVSTKAGDAPELHVLIRICGSTGAIVHALPLHVCVICTTFCDGVHKPDIATPDLVESLTVA